MQAWSTVTISKSWANRDDDHDFTHLTFANRSMKGTKLVLCFLPQKPPTGSGLFSAAHFSFFQFSMTDHIPGDCLFDFLARQLQSQMHLGLKKKKKILRNKQQWTEVGLIKWNEQLSFPIAIYFSLIEIYVEKNRISIKWLKYISFIPYLL